MQAQRTVLSTFTSSAIEIEISDLSIASCHSHCHCHCRFLDVAGGKHLSTLERYYAIAISNCYNLRYDVRFEDSADQVSSVADQVSNVAENSDDIQLSTPPEAEKLLKVRLWRMEKPAANQ